MYGDGVDYGTGAMNAEEQEAFTRETGRVRIETRLTYPDGDAVAVLTASGTFGDRETDETLRFRSVETMLSIAGTQLQRAYDEAHGIDRKAQR